MPTPRWKFQAKGSFSTRGELIFKLLQLFDNRVKLLFSKLLREISGNDLAVILVKHLSEHVAVQYVGSIGMLVQECNFNFKLFPNGRVSTSVITAVAADIECGCVVHQAV